MRCSWFASSGVPGQHALCPSFDQCERSALAKDVKDSSEINSGKKRLTLSKCLEMDGFGLEYSSSVCLHVHTHARCDSDWRATFVKPATCCYLLSKLAKRAYVEFQWSHEHLCVGPER